MSKFKNKWNQLYEGSGFVYSAEPIRLLKDHWQRLRKGKALDLAMGEGRNAVFLAQNGFEVTGFDISDVAVEKAKKLAYDKGVKIEAKVADLDLFIFPIFAFDTVIVSYFKPISRYYSEIYRTLTQGGTVLIESYTTDQLLREPVEAFENRDYYHPNELLKQLKDFRILFYNEDEIDGKSIAQCIAKKPTDRDAVKYGFAKPDEKDGQQGRFKAAEDLFKKK